MFDFENKFLIHLEECFLLHISWESLFVWNFRLCNYPLLFLISNVSNFLRMSNYNDKNVYIVMHCNLTIRVISLVKYQLWMMIKSKLLEQCPHWIKILHQLVETFFSPMQVSSVWSEIYIMHLNFSCNIIIGSFL